MCVCSSNEVRVFHRHIETLLYHGVVSVYVAARPDNSLCAFLVVNTRVTLRSETLLARVEYDSSVLKMLVPRLVHRLGAFRILSPRVLVQARSRNLQLQTLSIEDLVVIESG